MSAVTAEKRSQSFRQRLHHARSARAREGARITNAIFIVRAPPISLGRRGAATYGCAPANSTATGLRQLPKSRILEARDLAKECTVEGAPTHRQVQMGGRPAPQTSRLHSSQQDRNRLLSAMRRAVHGLGRFTRLDVPHTSASPSAIASASSRAPYAAPRQSHRAV